MLDYTKIILKSLFVLIGILVLCIFILFIQSYITASNSNNSLPSPSQPSPNQPSNSALEQNAPSSASLQLEEIYQQGILIQENTQKDNINQALTHFNYILNQAKVEYKDTRLYRARCYLTQNKLIYADQDVSYYLEHNNPSAEAYSLKALCQEQQNNLTVASKYYNLALSLDNEYAVALCGMSRICNKQAKLSEALIYAKRALQVGHLIANTELNQARKAIIEQDKKANLDIPSRIALLQEAIKYDPDYPEYHFYLALLVWNRDTIQAFQSAEIYVNSLKKTATLYQLMAVNLYLYLLYQNKNYTKLEEVSRKFLNGNQKYLCLNAFLGIAIVTLNEAKQANQSKSKCDNYRQRALVYYSLFYRIYIARDPKFSEPWVDKMSKEVKSQLPSAFKIVQDERYINRFIQIKVIIYPSKNLAIEEGDIITKVNSYTIYSVYELYHHLNDLSSLTIQRNNTIIELNDTQFSLTILKTASFCHYIELKE